MWRVALSALLSHWRRAPLQLINLLLGLALATALWSGVQAINAEARASYDRAAALLGQNRFAQLVPRDGQRVDQSVFVDLRRAGWLVSPVLEGRIRHAGDWIRVLGIDPVSAPAGLAPASTASPEAFAGFFTPPGLAFAAPETVAALSDATGLPRVEPAEGLLPGVLIMDIGIAQELLGASDMISRLVLWPRQPEFRTPLEAVAPQLVEKAPQGQADVARLTDSFHLNLTAFGFLAFAVGLFIVHGTIGLAFEQRRVMFRTLRALGLPLRGLIVLLAVEVLLLALVAGVVGVALGYVIAAALLPDVAATLGGLYGAEVSGSLSLRPVWWGGGLAMSVLGAAVAAGQSLWRLARLPLLAPAQPRAWARASGTGMAVQTGLAALLGLVALGLAQWGGGLIAGFAMLGALLLGAALSLPGVLSALLGMAERGARGVLAGWFWADTRQQVPGLSLALMALLLALAANVGVSTMVGSFRLTFTGWLDQRLASELYVTARNGPEAARLRAFLEPRSDAVLPIWNVTGALMGAPGQVYGVADHPTYRDHWPLLQAAPDVWDRVATGNAALINEQLARREGLAPGDSVTLPGGTALSIAGIYSDYGNPQGQAMIAVDRLAALYPDVPRLRFAVRLPPAQVPGLIRALTTDFGLPRDNLTDQATIKAFSLGVFEQTFAVTAALNVLTMAVAGLAMLTSLLTLAGMRVPQLAPVWALGLTRARLARLELARAVMLAALTMVLAIPVGLLLAWALLAVVNVAAFGWRLPMHLFPLDWLWLGGLSLMAAGLAAAWPAFRLARMAPADLLKVFANER